MGVFRMLEGYIGYLGGYVGNLGGIHLTQGDSILTLGSLPCLGRIPGNTTRVPPVGFELETNCFQFYAIANLDKTSHILFFSVDLYEPMV